MNNSEDEGMNFPDYDLFIILSQILIDAFDIELEEDQFAEIVNDNLKAHGWFFESLNNYKPKSERQVLGFFNEMFDEFNENYPEFSMLIKNKIQNYIHIHNLKYSFYENHLTISISGIFESILQILKNVISSDHNNRLKIVYKHLKALENNPDEDDILTSFSKLSNLIEGIVVDFSTKKGYNNNTLSSALNALPEDIFPHPNVRDLLFRIYKFWSDYPNIRHSGTEEARLRNVNVMDVYALIPVCISLLIFLFNYESGFTLSLLDYNYLFMDSITVGELTNVYVQRGEMV